MAHGHNSLRNAAQLVNDRRERREYRLRLTAMILSGTRRQKVLAHHALQYLIAQ